MQKPLLGKHCVKLQKKIYKHIYRITLFLSLDLQTIKFINKPNSSQLWNFFKPWNPF